MKNSSRSAGKVSRESGASESADVDDVDVAEAAPAAAAPSGVPGFRKLVTAVLSVEILPAFTLPPLHSPYSPVMSAE